MLCRVADEVRKERVMLVLIFTSLQSLHLESAPCFVEVWLGLLGGGHLHLACLVGRLQDVGSLHAGEDLKAARFHGSCGFDGGVSGGLILFAAALEVLWLVNAVLNDFGLGEADFERNCLRVVGGLFASIDFFNLVICCVLLRSLFFRRQLLHHVLVLIASLVVH